MSDAIKNQIKYNSNMYAIVFTLIFIASDVRSH